jgi:hypothetical protein
MYPNGITKQEGGQKSYFVLPLHNMRQSILDMLEVEL